MHLWKSLAEAAKLPVEPKVELIALDDFARVVVLQAVQALVLI